MDEKNQDLAQQYQDILDRYSKELSTSSETVPEPVPRAVVDEPLLLPPVIPPVSSSYSISTPVTPPISKSSNLFKYLFFLSLIVFLGVFGGIAYTMFFTIKSDTSISNEPTPTTASEVVPTLVSSDKVCQVNDKTYSSGESFTATDGCNTCVCGEDLMISCTEKSCEASSSTKSVSPTAVPTKKVAMKTYKDTKYQYQFDCPASAKYLVEATSINGNKIPYKQESCTNENGLYATVSIYDNTVVHSFGDFQTYVSSDKKYVAVVEGDASELISSFKFF